MSKFYNPITQEWLSKPDQPTSKTWEELDVPKALAQSKTTAPKLNPSIANKKPSSTKRPSSSNTSSSPSKPSSKKPSSSSKGIKISENYDLATLAKWTDTQLKRYIGQNKGLKQDGWETRVEMGELVLGQRGDVL